ncbi:Protein FAM200B [Dissostichus eleginoides]|uniref:Protein FAM200B n=1 Tax=Dissostichus eleginoides TaxID=100907 RepID=A0AAD9FEP9_DISEL|nr:Protein FAM200B [Dissostichus eleginoides]
MFPNSEIAKQYSVGRTKATQIVKGAIAPALDKEVTELCQKQPFGLMCDEGTSRSTEKEFVILVRVFEEDTLVTKFLHMPVCNIDTAELLFTSLTKVLSERNINWNNLVAFNSDNASVMKGRHNSVASRIKELQPGLVDIGCICHLVQLATGCGIKALHQPIEEVLQAIYSHFDISAKRCELYKEFVEFTDTDTLKLLRYCATRWLSLLTCINRVLNQWNALQAYFESHEDVEKPGKVRMLAGHLSSKETKLDFNVAFQAEGVMVHRLHKEIQFQDTSLQFPDEDLIIGDQAQTFLEDNKDELPVPKMLQAVRGFFVAVTTKMLRVFPLDKIVLQNLIVLDPESRHKFTPSSVVELGKRLHQLRLDLSSLREEVVEYQVVDRAELPEETRVDSSFHANKAVLNYFTF